MPPTHPMAEAWRRYRRMRLGVYFLGDDRQRAFIRPMFAKALRASWAEAKASDRQAAAVRQRNAAAEAVLAARHLALELAAAALSPNQCARRIDAIREELRRLPYRPPSVDIGALGADLTAELAALETIAATERKAA